MGSYSVYTLNGSDRRKVHLMEFCQQAAELCAGEIVINSIDRDGEMAGFDLDLARKMRSAVAIPLSMLGGAGTLGHQQALIDAVGVVGAAAGNMVVLKWPYRAVLINYARPGRL